MSEVELFQFGEREIRVIDLGGEPWWVAGDVATVLELSNMRSSLARLDEDEKGVHTMDTPGGPQSVAIINESGLYSLILRSRKPEAVEFKRWVTHEVLPSIRRTGSYGNTPDEIKATVTEWVADPEVMALIISVCAAVLAHTRWKHPQESMQAFAQLFMQPELPGFDQQEITDGEPE